MERKLIYVAGPYTAEHPYEVYENIHVSWQMSLDIWGTGHVPISPHLCGCFMGGICSEQIFIEGTMEMMRRCDAIMVLPGWQHSSGTKGEIVEAVKLGTPIFYRFSELVEWLRKQEGCERSTGHVRQDQDRGDSIPDR